MAGPIPVFSFVFAAYAATSNGVARAADVCALPPLSPRTPFRAAWRQQFARGASVFAKIGLLKGSGPLETRLAVSASGEAGEEFWVERIVESGLGFLGAPVENRRRPQVVAKGRQIRFHVINVLDWRIGACPDLCPQSQVACPYRQASDALLLSETGIS